ncbi:MAG: thermonuclease family protein [Clostridium sp.]|uniref:thermonuclease family protein n=1 Tax=Clostridium sp. TaxID=1506 RepID=UPI0039EAB85E
MIFKKILSKIVLTSMVFTLLLSSAGCSSEKAVASGNKQNAISTSQKSENESQEKAAELSKFNLKEAKVSRVVDGDTVELSDGNKVRLIGVNTPESTTRTEPYGKEASNYTKDQLTGKTVYLEKDVSETDQYGRLLRYVWIDVPNGITDSEIKTKMFNAILVENGYAEVSTYPPDVKYKEYFTKYNSEARNENKGLWSINHNGTTKGDSSSSGTSVNSSNTDNSKNTTNSNNSSTNTGSTANKSSIQSSSNPNSSSHGLIKGNINSNGEKIYHVPGGQFYDKTNAEQWFNTEQEAQAAGYRKSKR